MHSSLIEREIAYFLQGYCRHSELGRNTEELGFLFGERVNYLFGTVAENPQNILWRASRTFSSGEFTSVSRATVAVDVQCRTEF